MAPLEALKAIVELITEEVNQQGDNDDRFKALLRARKVANVAIAEAEKQSA